MIQLRIKSIATVLAIAWSMVAAAQDEVGSSAAIAANTMTTVAQGKELPAENDAHDAALPIKASAPLPTADADSPQSIEQQRSLEQMHPRPRGNGARPAAVTDPRVSANAIGERHIAHHTSWI